MFPNSPLKKGDKGGCEKRAKRKTCGVAQL